MLKTLAVLAMAGAALLAADLIPANNPAIYFSPYNTSFEGDRALWIYAGSYLKTTFTGTSAVLRIDIGSMAGSPPKFRWSIDGKQLQTASGSGAISLAQNLRGGGHTLTLYLAAADANYDRWQKPQQAIRVIGLELDSGATVKPPSGLATKRIVFFGDSITEGAWNLGNSNRMVDRHWPDWVAHSDATQAWPYYLATELKAEFGVIGSGGMSWLRPSHSGLPPLPESWAFHYSGHPRQFTPAPDYVIVNMGTNDGKRDTTAAVERWLRDVRAAIPSPAKIVVIIPFGQMNRDFLTRAVNNVADPNTRIIDLGPAFAEGLTVYGKSSPVSYDGLHPNAGANAKFARALYEKLR
jgi:lysophospholipase L1-like esterase